MKNKKKTLYKFLSIMVMIYATSFKPYTNELYISGKIFSDDSIANESFVGLHLFVIADKKLIAETLTEKDGQYQMTFTPFTQTSFDFYINGIGIDTIFLKSFTAFESQEITWNIKLPVDHVKKFGNVICPKCNKSDKVYPIMYGLQQLSNQIIKGSDTTYNRIVNKKYYAWTCIENSLAPQFYCGRDKIKF